MRYIEIVLKLTFLIMSVFYIVTKTIVFPWYLIFLSICVLLGLVLIFNKDSSYHYPQKPKDLLIRKIEGSLLIIFSVFLFGLLNFA